MAKNQTSRFYFVSRDFYYIILLTKIIYIILVLEEIIAHLQCRDEEIEVETF